MPVPASQRQPQQFSTSCPQLQRAQALSNVKYYKAKLAKSGVNMLDHMFVIDAQASAKFRHIMKDCSLCVTRARGGQHGHYISKLRRFMTLEEIGALQGIPSVLVDVMAKALGQSHSAALGRAFGDAMSINVLMRILPRALRSAGLCGQISDTWRQATEDAKVNKRLLKKWPDDVYKHFAATERRAFGTCGTGTALLELHIVAFAVAGKCSELGARGCQQRSTNTNRKNGGKHSSCLLSTSPNPRDRT